MDINPRIRTFFFELCRLGAIGLIAIGLSGLVSAGFGAAFGKSFVSGDQPGTTYTASRCADYQEYDPAPTCAAAATLHHFDEVVWYRVAAGVLGVLAFGGLLAISVFKPALVRDAGLHPSVIPAIGAVLFGLGALGLLGMGGGELVFVSAAGTGALISGGIVAFGVFAYYARGLLRTLG